MKIGILGAGTWGIALANLLCASGHDISVWSALPEEIEALNKTHIHPKFPDTVLSENMKFTVDIQKVCSDNYILVEAVPSIFIRSTTKTIAPYLKNGQIIVSVAKGIEESTLLTMSEVITNELGDIVREKSINIAALSGPTHAEEVIKFMPTTILSACPDLETANLIQDVFTNSCMRVYTNPDIKGVELCGALKNIIALASGILSGLGLGDNVKAALITRGLAEIKRLGIRMGCHEQTFYGLAGMGDLIVTALSQHSRNYQAGMLIGSGCDVDTALKKVGMVVESINAIKPAMELSRRYDIELPIIASVNSAIFEGISPQEALDNLMKRKQRSELHD